ncbi:MAG: adenine phosphoribosyltransferase [Chloroflexi bacterium]|nr:adenine phosphoribosyltransferase [Chloroflexota bacterium]
MDLKRYIRDIPDFPSPGILFRDITPLLKEPKVFRHVADLFTEEIRSDKIDAIVSIESRGFLFGAPLAYQLGVPLIPVRKPGKLPAAHTSIEYSLEYGTSQLDIHNDALQSDQRVVIVDDLLATGGTAVAAAQLVEVLGAKVERLMFLLELAGLDGREKLRNYRVTSLISYD